MEYDYFLKFFLQKAAIRKGQFHGRDFVSAIVLASFS